MIKANELRLGNLVAGAMGKVYKVDANIIGICTGSPDWVDPIELSSEILEKAGFESGGHYNQMWVYLPKRQSSISFRRDTKSICFVNDDSDNFPYISRVELNHIQYLHQLQNLYFALTGEELEIKL